MTYVAFDAGNPQRHIALAVPEGFGNGVALHSVAHNGAGGMGFDIVELPGDATRTGAGSAHQLHLSMAGWCGDVSSLSQAGSAIGCAGRIDRGGFNHRVDRVSVPFSRLQRLNGKDERPFRAYVSVGFRIKGMAFTIRTDHTQRIESSADAGRPQVIGRADKSLLAVTGAKRVDGRVQGGQAGGTRGATGKGRPHQIEVVRNPVGQHGHADTGNGKLGCPVRRAPVGGWGNLGADKNARGTVAQGLQVPADPLASFPGAAQQHPHVRVG